MPFLSDTLSLHTSSLFILLAVAFLGGLVLNMWRGDADATAKRFMLLISATTALLAIGFVIQKESEIWRNEIYTLISLQMLYGPFLYLYTRYQCDPNYQWRHKQSLHFLPALLFALLWISQQPLSPESWLYFDCHHIDCSEIQRHRFWHKVGAWGSIVSYTLLALRWLHPHETNIKAHFSTLEGLDLRWLQGAAWCLLTLTLIAIGADLSREMGMSHTIRGGHLQALGPFISIFLFAKYGIHQKKIYDHQETPAPVIQASDVTASQTEHDHTATEQAASAIPKTKKYQTSSLTESCAAQLWQQLQTIMQQEQPYLEPGLKISSLAKQLDVSVNHLSETINGYANLSFYDYINAMRIEEASRLLCAIDANHLSVTDIGYQAGFNSSSTFYTHFKKSTGYTPRQFRAQYQTSEKPYPAN